ALLEQYLVFFLHRRLGSFHLRHHGGEVARLLRPDQADGGDHRANAYHGGGPFPESVIHGLSSRVKVRSRRAPPPGRWWISNGREDISEILCFYEVHRKRLWKRDTSEVSEDFGSLANAWVRLWNCTSSATSWPSRGPAASAGPRSDATSRSRRSASRSPS